MGKRETQIVVFSLSHAEEKIELGVPVEKVREINRLLEITHVPEMPEFVEGVVCLRGQVIPVMDLRKRLGLKGNEHTEKSRIILFDIGGHPVGAIVDEVSEVLRIYEISPPPAGISSLSSRYLEGIAQLGQRLILLMALEEVFTTEEKQRLSTTITA
ncbi:CheW-like protein [Syntrophomonas zehnderi OL-4]|uniref:CheW-like protein n=1 Tax=Syntrophomonas zehnderi OL-4 TaxID=690567 RepID=A0A0E4C8E7_9FIRM|nr:chemotaxis protein CheW [Syntrophomonas zehnderi]CFX40113.1 CheW-like protein [Syntrophomonas zehnderi OL-4]